MIGEDETIECENDRVRMVTRGTVLKAIDEVIGTMEAVGGGMGITMVDSKDFKCKEFPR